MNFDRKNGDYHRVIKQEEFKNNNTTIYDVHIKGDISSIASNLCSEEDKDSVLLQYENYDKAFCSQRCRNTYSDDSYALGCIIRSCRLSEVVDGDGLISISREIGGVVHVPKMQFGSGGYNSYDFYL